MKNYLRRQDLGAALVLGVLLLAGIVVVVPKAATTMDTVSADRYGIDLLALNPEHE